MVVANSPAATTHASAPTLAERLDETKGRPTGFDYLRLSLSVLIVCFHSVITSHGYAAQVQLMSGPLRPPIALLLPMFFALSGFLVAGSLERTRTLGMFLGLRAIRIFPALAVESLIAALVIGPLVTTLTLREYVSDPMFRAYFLNIVGMVQFKLPGVFVNQPALTVNAQLWTIPYELECYIVLALLALFGIARRPVLLILANLGWMAMHLYETAMEKPELLVSTQGVLPGWLLVQGFLLGVLFYMLRARLPWHAGLGVGSLVISLFLLTVPYGQYPAVIFIAYLTIWLGLTNYSKIGLLKGADYSYGIFLYGFVVQQCLMYFFPWARVWWINILLALPTVTLVAAFSWYCVEKPAAGLRTRLAAWEDRWLAFRQARRAKAT